MVESITDLRHAFASSDCLIYVFSNGKIIIENDNLDKGVFITTSNNSAKELLQNFIYSGEIVPVGAMEYFTQ